jgi:UDP-N-acetylglucosamine:LPS N-acetylglucosamine transferase
VIFLPHNHNFFHPDLVHASDLVAGKVGYSTIAEVYSAQIPFLFIPRKNFRESEYLERFILREMNGQPMDLPTLIDGSLDQRVSNLFEINLPHHSIENGADQIAQFVCDDLLGEDSLRVFPKPV